MATSAVHNQTGDSIPLGEIHVSNPYLFQNDTVGEYFSRLRREDPVHYCAERRFGPYWSVTKFNAIMEVDTNHQVFASEAKLGGLSVQEMHDDERGRTTVMFISLDTRQTHTNNKDVRH